MGRYYIGPNNTTDHYVRHYHYPGGTLPSRTYKVSLSQSRSTQTLPTTECKGTSTEDQDQVADESSMNLVSSDFITPSLGPKNGLYCNF